MSTAVAKRTATAIKRKLKPVADVVLQFNVRIWQGDECRLQAAKLLLQLRERIEAGEEGDVAWWDWCEANIDRGRKDCEALLRLAKSPEPEQALIKERERVRLAVEKNRAEKERLLLTTNDGRVLTDNSGCNYDPADPRGCYEDEDEEDNAAGVKTIRRRAWLYMAHEAQRSADSFLSESGHRAITEADATEIDEEILTAVWDAHQAWCRVHRLLQEKRASTLPQDGRSEGAVDPPKSSAALFAKLEAELEKGGDDIGDIPACLDRRRSPS